MSYFSITVNLITPTGSVVGNDNAHAKDNSSVHEFRATTPSQPRYAEMFLNMKHDMEKMKQALEANTKKVENILQGPIRKQQENFDALSSFSEPFSIDGNLESIDSNSNDKKMEEVNNEVPIKKRLRKRLRTTKDPGPFIK